MIHEPQFIELWILPLAFLIDQIMGDPRSSLHPVVMIGRLGRLFEELTRKIFPPRIAGLLTVMLLISSCIVVCYLLLFGISLIPALLLFNPEVIEGQITEIPGRHLALGLAGALFISLTIASRSLYEHTTEVEKALRNRNLEAAREKTGMIVGRDTNHLSQEELIRASTESIAESLVDAITSPLFFATIGLITLGPTGGVLFALAYRVINTMDSMFGYKNEKYKSFGWAAAKLDDFANYIPARITPIFVSLGALLLRENATNAIRIWMRDGSRHPSPNSGQCEAAFSGALGVQFGGLNYYGGIPSQKPLIGDKTDEFNISHIRRANRLMLVTSCLFLMGCILLVWVHHEFLT